MHRTNKRTDNISYNYKLNGSTKDESLSENLVTIVSSDKRIFVIDKKVAMVSETIKTLLEPDSCCIESKTSYLKLPIQGRFLKKIIEFMKLKYDNESVTDFITGEDASELLDIAYYLQL